jgi:hypothetical protein
MGDNPKHEGNMETRKIRFIDSRYNTLFTINDGEEIVLELADGEIARQRCRYIDDYHFEAGNFIYHIYQFAEMKEGNGTRYRPA